MTDSHLYSVPVSDRMVPAADIHRFVVVDDGGDVMVVRRGNGQHDALTYRSVRGAERAAARWGGRVLDRQEVGS